MTNHGGKKATATINGTEVPLKNWKVNPSVPIWETVNSLSTGFIIRESAAGMTADISFDLDYDFDANPYATPIGLTIGATITNVKLYLNGTAGVFWNFPSAIIGSTPQDATVTAGINSQFTAKSSGTFAYPGAVTPSNA